MGGRHLARGERDARRRKKKGLHCAKRQASWRCGASILVALFHLSPVVPLLHPSILPLLLRDGEETTSASDRRLSKRKRERGTRGKFASAMEKKKRVPRL